MKRLDLITASILFIGSIWYSSEALKMPLMAGKAPGSGWMPLLLGVLMAFLSVLLFLADVRKPASQDKPIAWPQGRGLVNNIGILVGLAISVALLQLVGYLISTFVFLLGLLFLLGRYNWKFATGMAAASTAVLYWIFKIWLAIPLPPGLIHFE
mgnify:CR=1 FL=1